MYCAYITTLKELRKHSNADRLQCATVFGQNVIVDLSYQEGQKVVYFPTDGQLSEEYANDNNLVRKKDTDGNNIGGYMDESKRNVTAIRLRGEKSEGLVLPIETLSKYTNISKLKDGDQITVLDRHEICCKYIPRGNQRKTRISDGKKNKKNQSQEVISYPFFVEHKDTAQLAYNMNAFKPGDTIYLTRKLHGCFVSDTRIKMWGKNKAKKIKDIEKNDIVVGYKDGKFIPSKVLNTFLNGKSNEWRDIRYERYDLVGEKYGHLKCTPDHLFWDYKINDYKPAKDVLVGEDIGLVKSDWILDNISKSILLGMYLGDSHYETQESRHKGITATLQFSAKYDKIGYLEYINKVLGDFIIINRNKEYISGYGTRMIRGKTRYSIDLRRYFDSILDLSDSENKLTENIIPYFTWKSLLFMFLDDGSLSHSEYQEDRANLAICDYNEHDSMIIIKCLEKLGLTECTYYVDQKGYSRIRLNKNSANLMFDHISKYVPEIMQYKLPERYRCNENIEIISCNINEGYNYIHCKITENAPISSRRGSTKYDIQTETSNFVAGDLLVHNSSGRTAKTLKITKKKNWFRKLLHLKPKEIKEVSVVTGSRRVVLKDKTQIDGYYSDNGFRMKYHNLLKDKLPEQVEIYYEIVGYVNESTPIMGSVSNKGVKEKEFTKKFGDTTVFSYGCEPGESEMYVYRMTMTSSDGTVIEIPWETVEIMCDKMGLKHVPDLEKFIFTTQEDLLERVYKYNENMPADEIGKTHVAEGVVVRIDNRESFTAYKDKVFEFKVIEGIAKDTSDVPDMEEAQELITETVDS